MALKAIALMAAVPVGLAAWSEIRYALGKKRAERAFEQENIDKLCEVGSTRSLAILPLVDWYSARPELRGEPGVSYLVKTDQNTILMDVGLNFTAAEPSPLTHNMRELGISLADIDTIVISHRHADHVGGLRWLRRRTFSLGNEQVTLCGKTVFVPESMSYPGVTPRCSPTPTVVAPGVTTIGAIRSQIYLGRIDEQALAIRLEGKGIVLVVGCGHQSLRKILARTTRLFDEPIYGIVGGVHYPFPHGRWLQLGLDLQQLLVYGPLRGPRLSDIRRDIDLLAKHHPQWVSLSAHDSSDEMIAEFRSVFRSNYHDLRVGEWQTISKASREFVDDRPITQAPDRSAASEAANRMEAT
jgi:7,8-dihydropterin-6-yl-methyl-4-(beta-D-ribofuranosyl)aminobenzene 5'-phosphate synthase